MCVLFARRERRDLKVGRVGGDEVVVEDVEQSVEVHERHEHRAQQQAHERRELLRVVHRLLTHCIRMRR